MAPARVIRSFLRTFSNVQHNQSIGKNRSNSKTSIVPPPIPLFFVFNEKTLFDHCPRDEYDGKRRLSSIEANLQIFVVPKTIAFGFLWRIARRTVAITKLLSRLQRRSVVTTARASPATFSIYLRLLDNTEEYVRFRFPITIS